MQENETINKILIWQKFKDAKVLDWIRNATTKDLDRLLFNGKPLFEIPAKDLYIQALGYKILAKKAPEIAEIPGLVFPEKMFLEQCSSAWTGDIKAEIFKSLNAKEIYDITGGFGIDAWCISKAVQTYHHFEENEYLQQIADYNFKSFANNITSLAGDALNNLPNAVPKGSWIYADPMRRDSNNKRSNSWEDHRPNPSKLVELLKDTAYSGLLIKFSPMNNYSEILELGEGFHKALIAVEVYPELKELLLLVSKEPLPFALKVFLANKNGAIECIEYQEFPHTELNPCTSHPGFFYLPGAAISKVDLGDVIAAEHDLNKESASVKVYSSAEPKEIPGFRCFKVLEELNIQTKALKKKIGKGNWNVISKGFPQSANELTAKYSLVPKGRGYLIFYKGLDGFKGYETELVD